MKRKKRIQKNLIIKRRKKNKEGVKIIKIEEWMSTDVKTIGPEETVSKASQIMAENDIGCLPVVENEKIMGIVTERDMVKKIIAHHKNPEEIKVKEIMSKNPKTIDINTTFLEVSKMMTENVFRRTIITKQGKIEGIITSKDIVRMLATE